MHPKCQVQHKGLEVGEISEAYVGLKSEHPFLFK